VTWKEERNFDEVALDEVCRYFFFSSRHSLIYMRKASILLKNATLPDGRRADLSLAGGIVSHVGAPVHAERVIDCSRFIVMPAATDMHVHMRSGVQREKEDWESGSRSALAGGVTVVVDQPNTIPPLTTQEAIRRRLADARSHSWCHFAVNGGIGQGVDLLKLWQSGVTAFGEIFIAPSSYGSAVPHEILCKAFGDLKEIGAMATIHAEEVCFIRAGTLEEYHRSRPPAGEERAVKAVRGDNRVKISLHFCHLSTAGAVQAAGDASVEVTPHHLFLALEQFDPKDTHGKVNPPIRPEKERRRLWELWDRIDVIASDHAPHSSDDKTGSFEDAPSGVPGVETMMPLLMAQVLNKRCSRVSVIEKTSYRPSQLLDIPAAGFTPGCRADFALYPRQCRRIDPDLLHSRAGWTPFAGHAAAFPVFVIMGGDLVFEEGEFLPGQPQWYHGKGYINHEAMDDGADKAHP
jgi:dihydroorotase